MRARRQFEQLALPHLPALYRVARQTGGLQAADDLVQETILRAWTYFDSFAPGTNCRAWLFRILHNVWISQWRKSRLEFPIGDSEPAGFEPYYDWEPEFLDEQLSADMQSALDQLPAPYRWAVLLVDVEELTYQEAATIMECPLGTVMSRVNRGRRLLAQGLRPAGTAGRAPQVAKVRHR